MSTSTIIILAGIVSAFAVFGFTLAWGDYQTRSLHRDRNEADTDEKLPPMKKAA